MTAVSAVFILSLDDGTNSITANLAVTDNTQLTAANMAGAIDAAFAGTANDGDTQSGFAIDYGGALDLTTAVSTGTLNFFRADGVDFDVSQSVTGDRFDTAVGFSSLGLVTSGDDVDNVGGTYVSEPDVGSITTTDGEEAVTLSSITIADDLSVQLSAH